jgi:hypothetical protein
VKRVEEGVERRGDRLRRACARCGGEAWVSISNRRQLNTYCSAGCRLAAASERWNRRVSFDCLVCGTTFSLPPSHADRHEHRFCSSTCYGLYQREHPHGGTAVDGTTRVHPDCICKHCGRTFRARRARGNPYCSDTCAAAAQQAAAVVVTCARCGKVGTYAPSIGTRRLHCSEACARADTLYGACERCGKRFLLSPPGRRHCSEACRRPPILIDCQECGKTFRIVPSMAGVRQFCSFMCYRRHTGETGPERNARLSLEALGLAYVQEHRLPGWRYSVDFFLPDSTTIVEIDDAYWHARTAVRDARKADWFRARGYRVLRIDAAPFYGPVTPTMVDHLRRILAEDDVSGPQTARVDPLIPESAAPQERMVRGSHQAKVAVHRDGAERPAVLRLLGV